MNQMYPEKLYPHQREIALQLESGKRIVVSDPRCGKTRPVIAFLGEGNVLVLTKKAAIGGWLSELSEMGVSGWTVLNYEKVRTRGWDVKREWGALVLDECHFLGSYPKPNLCVKVIWDMPVRGPRVGITATPCAESYSQLYHQSKALKLDIWGSYRNFYSWHKKFGVPDLIRAHGRMVETYRKCRTEVWDSFKDFCCVVRRAEVVPDFVEAKDVLVELEDTGGVVQMCSELRKEGVIYVDGHAVVADTPMALAQKCQQICNGVVLSDTGEPVVVNTLKRDWVFKEFGESVYGVLTQFRGEVDLYGGGGVSDFQKGLVNRVVGNVAALNAGVDLSRAELMVLTGCPWSVTIFLQARERLLRRDRTREAMVYFPVIAGGIDSMIYNRVAVQKVDFHSRAYLDG